MSPPVDKSTFWMRKPEGIFRRLNGDQMPTYQEIKKREEQIRKRIDDGMIVADIARDLGLTPQSVHKFMNVRGWEPKVRGRDVHPHEMKRKLAAQKKNAASEAKKKERLKLKGKPVDRSGSANHKG